MKVSCIYIIKSKIKPNRFYIGSSKDFIARRKQHMRDLSKKRHHNKKLQRHFDKYGAEDFLFQIIEIVENEEKLLNREQFFLDRLKPCFNIWLKANSPLGIKLTPEQRLKRIGTKNGSGKRSEAFKEYRRQAMIGTCRATGKRSKEFCEKRRLMAIGNNSRAKKYLNIKTGEILSNGKDVAKIVGLSYVHFMRQMRGECKNKTQFKFAS